MHIIMYNVIWLYIVSIIELCNNLDNKIILK